MDRQVKMIQARVRQLMNGEVAQQLQNAGYSYRKLYGVSLVHLRQLSQEFKPSNEIAERLWFMNIREMMILATMIAERDTLTDEKLSEWADGITNIELAEQVAFNLLGKRQSSLKILEKWILHPQVFVRYAALMSIGWQYRFAGEGLSAFLQDNLSTIEALAGDNRLVRAVAHCLKMAGRFDKKFQPKVVGLARKWIASDMNHLKQAGEEILFEIEAAG